MKRSRDDWDELDWRNEWTDDVEEGLQALTRIAAALEAIFRGKLEHDEPECSNCGCTNTYSMTRAGKKDPRKFVGCPACQCREYFCVGCGTVLPMDDLDPKTGLCKECTASGTKPAGN